MPTVKVRKKGQITLPVRLRAKAGIAVGDTLEAKLERGRITLARTSATDRQIAESLELRTIGKADSMVLLPLTKSSQLPSKRT